MEGEENYPRFSDFVKTEESIYNGTELKLKDILNKEILVMGYKIRPSKKKEGTDYLTIQFKIGDTMHVVFTSSLVLTDQIVRYEDKMPFYARIVEMGKYYTFI